MSKGRRRGLDAIRYLVPILYTTHCASRKEFITAGFNYLNDSVLDTLGTYQDKDSYDIFAGVTQIFDKNTVFNMGGNRP